MTRTALTWKTVVFILCVFVTDVVFCQARYSIPEEMPEGSFVGDIAKDLGIEISRLISGKARVVTKGGRQYVDLSRDKGTLVVKERIDREELCKQTTPCSFSFDLIIENPIQLHRVIVEVQDTNDNAPKFPKDIVNLHISENTASGTRFHLDSAVDMDVGMNGIQSYALSPTEHFKLEVSNQANGNKYVEMVLQHELDREQRNELKLVLIAHDGGSPKKSGTVRIHISVLDVNDNAPVCKQSLYKAEITENSPVGTVLTTVNAADADEGINRQVSYSFAQASEEARDVFEINAETGDITTLHGLDYETEKTYILYIKAMDKGSLADTCKVVIDVIDENDNSPNIQLMSFSNTLPENSPLGTTVAIINVEDADSGKNGLVQCAINENIPFKIQPSLTDYYALITDDNLDRESIAEYNITIVVSDQGSPAKRTRKIIHVKISDVNDNPPAFVSGEYRAFVFENNSPGVPVLTVKAIDGDSGPNAQIAYFLEDINTRLNPSVNSFITINSDSGVIHAIRAFDYEQMKTLTFNVTARDGGSPPLSSEVTVTIVVQDQNDNAPQVLYPVQTGGSLVAEIVPRSADVGYLVTKVVAVDVDSGQNAWLSYKLQKATDRALFEVGPQNGEIRTVRQVTDKDAVKQKLTVVVEDNGQPSRSAVVYINVAVADSFPEVLSEFNFTHEKQYNDNLTFYLVLALAAVSFLFITCLLVIISVKIYRWRQSHSGVTGTLPHMYNYDVCMTNDSRKSDCKYSTLGGQNVLLVDPSFTKTTQNTPKGKFFLEDKDSSESSHLILRFYPKFRLVYIPTVSCLPCGLVFTMCIKVSTFLRILLDVRNVVIIVAYCFSASLLSFSLNFCFILSLALASCLAT
uniref:Cadherin domain-containing protein n=1 Tax=Electrophorus electricus TaxID=8005 RepID=A0AAY5ERW0_ELEEL